MQNIIFPSLYQEHFRSEFGILLFIGGQCSLSTCPCDEGYFHHEESGSCFMVSRYSATWPMSFQICKNRDANLAKVDTKSKLDFIRSKTRLYYIYIGLKQVETGFYLLLISSRGGDQGSLWYRYQLIREQIPPKLRVLVPPVLGEGANNWRLI